MTAVVATNQTILVVGGGISGVTAALEKTKAACKYGAIDLGMQEKTIRIKAGAGCATNALDVNYAVKSAAAAALRAIQVVNKAAHAEA